MSDLVIEREGGLYCPAGDFHIDPWRPVERALITHAHSDHARWGSRRYLTAAPGAGLLRQRVGPDARVEGVAYGEELSIGGVGVSFHSAGHMLGAAQIRLERSGEVWVISGDYKTQADPTCTPFELVRCHTFITESTFGLPVYRWPDPGVVMSELNAWWRANAALGRTSVILTYSLGKPQRLLSGLDPAIGPIGAHGAIERFLPAYREAGVRLPEVRRVTRENFKDLKGRALILAPLSVGDGPWLRKFAPFSDAIVSGWMRIRGARRWRSADRGFVMSDHVDWPSLLDVIAATGAERVGVTHGYTSVLVRWLREQGRDAWALATRYGEEEAEPEGETPDGGDAGLLDERTG